jgi:hypothetical protein
MPPRLSSRTSGIGHNKRRLASIEVEVVENSHHNEKEDTDRDYLDNRDGEDMSGGMTQHHQQQMGVGVGIGAGGGGSSMNMGLGGDMGGMLDDGDNRTRNARAQRRHREKRKAMTAAVR